MARITMFLTLLTTIVGLLGGFRYVMDELRAIRERKRLTGFWFILLLLLLPTPELGAQQPLWTPVLATARAADWEGMVNMIPDTSTWTQCGADVQPPSSSTAMQAVIDACGSATDAGGKFIKLAPGQFRFDSGVKIKKSRLKIIGSGANLTEVRMNGTNSCYFGPAVFCFGGGDPGNFYYNGGGPAGRTAITAGAVQGSTQITVADASGIFVGDGIFVREATQNGNETLYKPWLGCSTKYNVGSSPGQNSCTSDPAYLTLQVSEVTQKSGNVLTLRRPLYYSDWSQTHSPEVWYYTVALARAFIHDVGVEDLSITPEWTAFTSGGPVDYGSVQMFRVHTGWTMGIRVNGCDTGCVFSVESTRITHHSDYIYNTRGSENHNVSTQYGVAAFSTTDLAVINTIFHKVQAPIMYGGVITGSAIMYNFGRNNVAAYFPNNYPNPPIQFIFSWKMMWSGHGTGVTNVLHEGNDGNSAIAEHDHGSGCCFTHYRNVYDGLEPNNGFVPYRFAQVLELQTISGRFSNALGNVLGHTGYHNNYESSNGAHGVKGISANSGTGTSLPGESSIFHLGWKGTEGDSLYDATVESSFYRWGNIDPVTGRMRNCGNNSNANWTTDCKSATEVPSGQFIPSSTALPASFAYRTKPSYFTASMAWPLIGPDVTGTFGALNKANKNAARLCYEGLGGVPDGTGPMLAFNRQTCYGSGGPTPPAAPGAPTILRFAELGGLITLVSHGFYLWQKRAAVEEAATSAATKVWASYQKLHDTVWMWSWKRAVKRWQQEAPTMLEDQRTVIVMKQQPSGVYSEKER